MIGRAGESRLGLLGAVVDIAGGQEQGFGGLAIGGALGAAMDEASGGAQAGGVEWHVSGPCLALARPLSSPGTGNALSLASLARLFHLAAIRPDKSRGPGTAR